MGGWFGVGPIGARAALAGGGIVSADTHGVFYREGAIWNNCAQGPDFAAWITIPSRNAPCSATAYGT